MIPKNRWLVKISAITGITIITCLSIAYGLNWEIAVLAVGTIGTIAGGKIITSKIRKGNVVDKK